MERPLIYGKGPEEKIVQDIVKYLSERDWYIKRTVGNQWQQGLPDLWVGHRKWGHRWVEVKNPLSYEFTAAQLEWFPIFSACGNGIWILTGATPAEYNKLFSKPNWTYYLHKL